MIAHLRGTILEKHPNQVIVDVGGVGYDVTIPVSTFSALPNSGSEVKLRVYTHVREDALSLFGFLTPEERILFEKLISVTGIGPKLAITALSGLPTGNLVTAIRGGSVDQLVKVPGIGKKTAERIVLELKDKLEMLPSNVPVAAISKPEPAPLGSMEQDVLSALVNLGCQRPNAETAVRKAKAEINTGEFEPLFRRALELVR